MCMYHDFWKSSKCMMDNTFLMTITASLTDSWNSIHYTVMITWLSILINKYIILWSKLWEYPHTSLSIYITVKSLAEIWYHWSLAMIRVFYWFEEIKTAELFPCVLFPKQTYETVQTVAVSFNKQLSSYLVVKIISKNLMPSAKTWM